MISPNVESLSAHTFNALDLAIGELALPGADMTIESDSHYEDHPNFPGEIDSNLMIGKNGHWLLPYTDTSRLHVEARVYGESLMAVRDMVHPVAYAALDLRRSTNGATFSEDDCMVSIQYALRSNGTPTRKYYIEPDSSHPDPEDLNAFMSDLRINPIIYTADRSITFRIDEQEGLGLLGVLRSVLSDGKPEDMLG